MDPYLAEIRCFGFTFAPTGWLMCNGQMLTISQYTALFSLLGTYYGGNGTTNFQLPNLQGMVPIGQGTGPGLPPVLLGQTGGEANHTLITQEMPSHYHSLLAKPIAGINYAPAAGSDLAQGHGGSRGNLYTISTYTTTARTTTLNPAAVGAAGGSQPHNNMQPSLTMNWCIAWQGVYPPRT